MNAPSLMPPVTLPVLRDPGPGWTLARFLQWEREQDARFEFDGAEPVALNGGSLRHTRIALSLAVALDKRLDFDRFEVVRGDAKIIVNGHLRYPDVVVFRHGPGGDLGTDIAPSPVVVVEVLSRSTRRVDQYDKNVDYAATPSIEHYVMLSQERRAAVVCSRTEGRWRSKELDGEEPLRLDAVEVEVPFSEIYRRITFGDEFFF